MNILIIEDEIAAARRLKKLILSTRSDAVILDELDSVKGALKWFNSNPMPDGVFMDVQLADGICFDIFKQFPVTCPVIFVTAHDEFALRAFEVNAVAYILKPVKQKELESALQKLEKLPATPPDYKKLFDYFEREDKLQKRLLIKIGQTIRTIETTNLAYAYTENKIVSVVNFDNKRYPTDHTLDELEEILDPKIFFRINRQIIVSNKAIQEMHIISKSRVKIILSLPTSIDTIVSVERSPAFKQWLTGKAV
jgi:two-component system LytT family response regulator